MVWIESFLIIFSICLNILYENAVDQRSNGYIRCFIINLLNKFGRLPMQPLFFFISTLFRHVYGVTIYISYFFIYKFFTYTVDKDFYFQQRWYRFKHDMVVSYSRHHLKPLHHFLRWIWIILTQCWTMLWIWHRICYAEFFFSFHTDFNSHLVCFRIK